MVRASFVLNFVRDVDYFAVPVNLTYKGKRKFGTLLGGCCTLVIVLGLVTYALYTLQSLVLHPILRSSSEKIYFSWFDNDQAFNITTKESSMAVRLTGPDGDTAATNRNIRVVFARQHLYLPGAVYIPAVNCSEFFKDEIAAAGE